jgi:alpha-tubulin suppressor-like RCC1 family protein
VWGSNRFGQLGLGKKTTWTGRPVPLDIPNLIFTCIAAGSYHSVAIDHLNRVWTWGWGVYGQLGNGSIENIYKPQMVRVQDKAVFASAGHSHTAVLTCLGKVLTFGCNHFGQLGVGSKEVKIKTPQLITALPAGTIIRLVECGVCSTVSFHIKSKILFFSLCHG